VHFLALEVVDARDIGVLWYVELTYGGDEEV
jgi:hypothetical protein